MSKRPEYETREQWLNALVDELRSIIEEHKDASPAIEIPDRVRISCGWPSRQATSVKRRRIGECWQTFTAEDGVRQMFISPVLDDPAEVAHVTLHELVHAVLPDDVVHQGPFPRVARAVGLEGKPTATTAGPKLAKRLKQITDGLGPYPHSALKPSGGRRKQSTRMHKVECPDCGYVVRTTQKWIEVGLPSCPDGHEMELS